MESSNQILDRIISEVEKKSDKPISPVNSCTSDELIQIIVANNDRLKRGIPVIRLNLRIIKPENPILLVATPVITESSDRDFSKFSPTIKRYKINVMGMLLPTAQLQLKSLKLGNRL